MIDTAFYLPGDNSNYFFCGGQYCFATGFDPPRKISDEWKGLPSNFEKGIDAAFHHSNNKTYLFRDDEYVRYSGTQKSGPTQPRKLPGGWGMNEKHKNFKKGIDAAVLHGDGNSYWFSGPDCVRIPRNSYTLGDPRPIKDVWMGLPEEFQLGIDTAFRWADTTHLVSGDKYVIFREASMNASGGPESFAVLWSNKPKEFRERIYVLTASIDPQTGKFRIDDPNPTTRYSFSGSRWFDCARSPLPAGTGSEEESSLAPFELNPGGGVTVRCGPGMTIETLKIFQQKAGPGGHEKGVEIASVKPGESSGFPANDPDAGARCTEVTARLTHRHTPTPDEENYFFGIRFHYANVCYDWDPEVHDKAGAGTRRRRAPVVLGKAAPLA